VPSIGARPWIGTFHSTLSAHAAPPTPTASASRSPFAVYDTADQLTLVRRCMRELQMNDESFPPALDPLAHLEREERADRAGGVREAQSRLLRRARGRRSIASTRKRCASTTPWTSTISSQVRPALEEHEDVREEIHSRFQHLLVDEYQDTNRAQYVLIKALAGARGNIVAVGDEDQSIYRFRGADINNILNFERDFPARGSSSWSRTIASTGNILDAATGVVANNIRAQGKAAIHEGGSGRAGAHRHRQHRSRRGAVRGGEDLRHARAIPAGGLRGALPHERAVAGRSKKNLLRANMP